MQSEIFILDSLVGYAGLALPGKLSSASYCHDKECLSEAGCFFQPLDTRFPHDRSEKPIQLCGIHDLENPLVAFRVKARSPANREFGMQEMFEACHGDPFARPTDIRSNIAPVKDEFVLRGKNQGSTWSQHVNHLVHECIFVGNVRESFQGHYDIEMIAWKVKFGECLPP